MKKQFIPYELALKLKELGFNEACFYYFNKSKNNQLWQDIEGGYYRNSVISVGNLLWGETFDNGNISAPLWQQAFEFFREKYNLDSYVRQITKNNFKFEINYIFQNDSDEENLKQKHYEDNDCISILDANIKCVKKLIEIIKNN